MGMTPILSIFHFLLLSLPSSSLLAAAANQSKDKKMPFVDVNIGTDISNLFMPENLVAFLKSQQITHIRLYEANPALLAVLTGTGICVILGIPNNQLLTLASSNAIAITWVTRHVLPFHPTTLISAVVIGDEVPNSLPSTLSLLLPALRTPSPPPSPPPPPPPTLLSSSPPFSLSQSSSTPSPLLGILQPDPGLLLPPPPPPSPL